MRFRGFVALACAALLSISLAGCCCPPTDDGGGGPRYGGPTLRAGFVRITKNADTKAVAFYSTDRNDDAIAYWISYKGGLPVDAEYPDVLHYHYLNEVRVTSPEEMCAWYAANWTKYDPTYKFPDPEVVTVHSEKSDPMPCD